MRNEPEKNESSTEVISVQIIGISEMEIRIKVCPEGEHDGGDYQAANWDYWVECPGKRSESGFVECANGGYPRRHAPVIAVPSELPVLA